MIKTHLRGVEELQEIIKLVVVSGFLKEHKPLSIIIVGKVGSGKTDIISTFRASNVVLLSDLSSTGVYDILNDEKRATHLIIPDFTKITMKNKATSNNLMTTLNAVMEEGLKKVRLKNTKLDFNNRNLGIITSSTKASFSQNIEKFNTFGFDSRFIILSFSYSKKTELDIMESIYNCEYLQKKFKQIKLKTEKGNNVKKDIVKIPYELAKKLNKLGENEFRTQKQLQALACSNTLVNERKTVTQEDIDKILSLSKFFNLKYTPI